MRCVSLNHPSVQNEDLYRTAHCACGIFGGLTSEFLIKLNGF